MCIRDSSSFDPQFIKKRETILAEGVACLLYTSGVLLLFTYPLLFLVEKTFGFTSNVTLVELSNINNSLLRRMSETVPM